MSIKVEFQNQKTGETKTVKVGWSWTLFFFASFLGIPLFLRKLNTLGAVFLVVFVLNFVTPEIVRDPDEKLGVSILLNALIVGLNTWMAIKGNEMTARNYLDLGWSIARPQSAEATIAGETWNLPINDLTTSSPGAA